MTAPVKRTGPATILDVARACQLSKTTVSKVMNLPEERLDVSAATRRRVLAAAQRLGYRPNWLARAFAHGRTHTIGLLHIGAVPLVASGLWRDLLQDLTARLQASHFDVQMVPSDLDAERLRQHLLDARLEGCVVLHELTDTLLALLKQSGLPAVALNADGRGYCPAVLPDDGGGARALTEHLLALGHRRIVFVEGTHNRARHFSYRCRYEGIAQALAAAGVGRAPLWISDEPAAITDRVLALVPRPTAVIAYDDHLALPLLHGFWRRGLDVPRDISVATFNNSDITRYTIPPLTTMDVPAVQVARDAAEILLRQLEGAARGPRHTVLVPETLVVRESTAAPAAQ